MPELRWAGRVHRRSSLSGTLELVRSEAFDPFGDVALPGRRNENPSGAASAGSIAVESAAADRAALTVDAAGPGHVIFSRTYLPVWKARVDGAAALVGVANARDLAVAIPAGRHRVEIAYDRAPFRLGVALQAAAVLIALGVTVATRSRGERPATPSILRGVAPTVIPRSVSDEGSRT